MQTNLNQAGIEMKLRSKLLRSTRMGNQLFKSTLLKLALRLKSVFSSKTELQVYQWAIYS